MPFIVFLVSLRVRSSLYLFSSAASAATPVCSVREPNFGHHDLRAPGADCEPSQILRSWTVVQFFQHRVSTRVVVGHGEHRFVIVQVAKLNRLGRTGILAGGRDFVGSNRSVAFGLGLDLGVLNSLHTDRCIFPSRRGCES